MSTILKALKKVEGKREAVTAKTEIPRALKSPATEESRSWSKGIVVIAIFLVTAVGATVGYHFWQSDKEMQLAQESNDGNIPTEIQVKKSEISNSIEKQESTIPPPSTWHNLSSKEPGASEKHPSPNQFTETTIQSPSVVVNSPPVKPMIQQKSRPSVQKQTSKNLIAKPQNRVAPEPQMRSKASVEPKPSTPAVLPIENSPKAGIPLLEDRSLKIQALVYSEDVAKRMIVLNGEILRQGYKYKGYTIETIESQRILVKKNGKVSALIFGK